MASLKKCLRFLSFIDLFQQPVSLRLYNKFRVSLLLGKFFSVSIFIFLLYSFITSDMIMHSNPFVLQQSFESSSRPLMNFQGGLRLDEKRMLTKNVEMDKMKNDHLNELILQKNATNSDKHTEKIKFSRILQNNVTTEKKLKLALALGLTDGLNVIHHDETIFQMDAFQYLVINGTNSTKERIRLRRCQESDFKDFSDEFKKLGLHEALCLNGDFRIGGFWDEEKMNFLQVSINKCVNGSEITCKSNEEIQRFFSDKYFSYWIEQNSFDLNNYKEPVNPKIKNLYRGLEYGQTKIIRFFMKKANILTDSGIIYPQSEMIESYTHGNIEYDSTSSETELGRLVFYSSEVNLIFQRRYQKMFDVLASLGGVVNVFIIFGSIIIKYIHDWNINELILKKLHAFKFSYNNFTFKKTNLNQNFDMSKSEDREGGRKTVRESSSSESNPIIVESKERFKVFQTVFNLSLIERLLLICKKRKRRNEQEKIYLNFLKKSKEKIDLIEILKKIEEIEKIKQVIFNREQLRVFNGLTKRNLYPGEDVKCMRQQKFCFDFSKPNNQKWAIEEYINKEKKKKFSSEIDKRLVNLIDC